MADGTINEKDYWSRTISKPIYNAWCGLAFERVCFQHIDQIKHALGISGIISNVYSWVYVPRTSDEKGAQIDMLIDRDDNVINICEMKFSQGEYELTEKYDLELRNKVGTFQAKTKTRLEPLRLGKSFEFPFRIRLKFATFCYRKAPLFLHFQNRFAR